MYSATTRTDHARTRLDSEALPIVNLSLNVMSKLMERMIHSVYTECHDGAVA